MDKQNMMENIKYLALYNNIEMKELEKEIGVSNGYISRCIGSGSKKNMSVDVACKIADYFEISLQELVYKPIWKINKIKVLTRKKEEIEEVIKTLKEA